MVRHCLARPAATSSFHHFFPHPRRGCARRGQVRPHTQLGARHLVLTPRHPAEWRARARVALRFIYKVKGPEACNFPVTPELAAELDALTVEQIHEQFKQRCAWWARLGPGQKCRRRGRAGGVLRLSVPCMPCLAAAGGQTRAPASSRAWRTTRCTGGGRPTCRSPRTTASPRRATWAHVRPRSRRRSASGPRRASWETGARTPTRVHVRRRVCGDGAHPAEVRCMAAQVHHQGALGPLQQPGAGRRSGAGRTLRGVGLAPLRCRAQHASHLSGACGLRVRAGRALAVEVLGETTVGRLEVLVRGTQVRPWGGGAQHHQPRVAVQQPDAILWRPLAPHHTAAHARGVPMQAAADRSRQSRGLIQLVNFHRQSQRWYTRVRFPLPGGQVTTQSLGYPVSQEQAAERVSAAAFVLRDRCGAAPRGRAQDARAGIDRSAARTQRTASPTRLRLRRCRSEVPLGRFSNLPPAQGQARDAGRQRCDSAHNAPGTCDVCGCRVRPVCALCAQGGRWP